jgi:rhamnosyltransferase
MRTALIILVRNAAAHLDRLLEALACQTLKWDHWLVIDTESSDGSAERLKAAGARVCVIPQASFNHGGTRRWASEQVEADVLIFLTQDAIPSQPDSLELLCQPFQNDPSIGAVYGRQLPHPGTRVFGAHARRFNYPEEGRTKRMADAAVLGIKTCFCSDSFCAYRTKALEEVGGFPEDVIGTEDAHVAGRMLLAGWAVRYEAGAKVFHAHDYTLMEEFRRYFDIGVFYGRERWIAKHFGKAGGEGARFVRSEWRTLRETGQVLRLPEMAVRTGLKWLGYQFGYRERLLPILLKRQISMFKEYWN